MKKSEIQVGKTYFNSRGFQRHVLKLIPLGRYKDEIDFDVHYKHLSGKLTGKEGFMWRPYFAKWAKGVIE